MLKFLMNGFRKVQPTRKPSYAEILQYVKAPHLRIKLIREGNKPLGYVCQILEGGEWATKSVKPHLRLDDAMFEFSSICG